MKTFKDKFPITALFFTFVGVFLIGIVIGVGVILFNEKTIVVPDDELTIQDAVHAAGPGDIILVKASGGPYEENVTIDKGKIKLIGIGKTKPILDGDTVVGGNGITINNTSGVLVKNFTIQNFDEEGIFLDSSTSNMIKGNTLNENGNNGISMFNNSGSNIIKGNTANGNENPGIGIFNSESNMIIGNTANGNIFNGILLVGSPSNMIIRNTTNGNDEGIELTTNSDSNMIKGNNVNDNVDNGILFSAGSNDNDVFFNRAFRNGDGTNTVDINDQDANNFKGNKCGTSIGANVDCPN
ncbi:right-handed parallel beta-helix repeat-containing protein [Bacillus spongiae]|uniref:Right-handed parallel beta-helix repeat-containing protein n=1 Tax=Bacillus spongiae TaxID=2683610 RepID=A0ABU8HE37_9BACI